MSDLTSDIEEAYARRDDTKGSRYGWWRPDVVNQNAIRGAAVRRFLHHAFGTDLSATSVLDAGCGDGRLLRSLLECGVEPGRMLGVDMLSDRIESARRMSPPTLRFEVEDAIDVDPDRTFSLVTAFTVLSSITQERQRIKVLEGLWNRVEPGGWLLVFDFRFNNPSNPDVTGVRPRWISNHIHAEDRYVKTMFTPPPIARRLAPVSPILDRCFGQIVFPLRSHYLLGLNRGAKG